MKRRLDEILERTMIVELAIGAGLVALGVVGLRTIKRKRQAAALPEQGSGTEESKPVSKGEDPPPKTTTRHKDPRGLRVGDVLLYADTEFWLSGEVYVDEEGFVLAIFPTPGTARADYVVQLDVDADQVAFCKNTDVVPDGQVPTELPVDGMRLKLKRRGQATISTAGENLPLTSKKADYTVLGGPGGKVLIVVDFGDGDRLALHGERLTTDMYDLLPGG